jgi:oxygen-dependent protoporphyrinogen oxidase
MAKKRVIILGGGISGLSLALYLSDYSEQFEILLLEKSDRLGGWIRTERVGGFLFERGPHTFRTTRASGLLELAERVGLTESIIYSHDAAKRRFLLLEGELQSLPKWPIIKSLFHEWRVPKLLDEDESVFEFASRRFSEEVAELFFDPLVLGIYAGDMRALSLQSCFPFFKQWEEKYGSVTKGLLKGLLRKRPKAALFSFKEGAESLVDAICQKIEGLFQLNQQVKELRFFEDRVELLTNQGLFEADHLFCSLPPQEVSTLLEPHDGEITSLLQIPMKEVAVVNIGYTEDVLPLLKGFGYLAPTREQQEVLGVLFDSIIFPQQNSFSQETRLTMMMHQSSDCSILAQKALRQHLNITLTPDTLLTTSARIPQYHVGHRVRTAALRARMAQKFPRMTLHGNYLDGVSVNDCIALSKSLALQFSK